ncbi:alpha/beta hydrolase [Paenibacillus cremeus]|uniref:Lysophospholipase n=1 Tax=Paenibacillus cremeus TaxID=2163881 RepID=A0A559KEJ3_9BACL|nr:alpha/beta hydrolase [Paenibacillus cremeus]TVY10546.1 lysophospholipase [Paenibacillus cremeus]
MKYAEFSWQSTDGARMFGCEWRPEEEQGLKAVVIIVHGMGEHSGRYSHVADALTSEGYAVLSYDQRGHGRTEGKRGHIPSYDALLESLDVLFEEAKRRYPALQRFILGHSMGGNVTLNYILRRKPEISGAIVTAPWLKLAFQPPQLQVWIGRIAEQIYPSFTNHRPMAAEQLTSDPEMIRRYAEDPLGHGQITFRFFFSMQRAAQWAMANAGQLSIPLLLLHGGNDKVTSIDATRQFAYEAGALCSFREWPGYRHELHNELEREHVIAYLLEWLNDRCIPPVHNS